MADCDNRAAFPSAVSVAFLALVADQTEREERCRLLLDAVAAADWPASYSTADSMALLYDTPGRIAAAVGDVGRDVVIRDMAGPAHHHLLRTVVGGFFCTARPAVGLADYLVRLQHYLKLSAFVFVVATALLHRVSRAPARAVLAGFGLDRQDGDDPADERPAFSRLLSVRTVHRLAMTSLRLASKMVEDRTVSNEVFATVAGVGPEALVRLEATFCRLIDYDLGYIGHDLVDDLEAMRKRALAGAGADCSDSGAAGRSVA